MKKILFVLIILSLPFFAFGYDPLNGFSTGLEDFMPKSQVLEGIKGASKMTPEQKEILKEKKLTPNAECLIKQIKKNNIENVKLLLDCNVNPNASYYGDYPVYTASKYNRDEMVRLLLEHGAKLDRGFYSELYEAVKNKNEDLAYFLINNGSKINYRDAVSNNTVLSVAIKNKMYELAKTLIQKGAKPDSLSLKLIKQKKLNRLVEDALKETRD